MSCVLVMESGEVLGAWQGDPREGDIIWFEQGNKLLVVGTVVHSVGHANSDDPRMSTLYTTRMIKVFVEEIEPDGAYEDLVKNLQKLSYNGL